MGKLKLKFNAPWTCQQSGAAENWRRILNFAHVHSPVGMNTKLVIAVTTAATADKAG